MEQSTPNKARRDLQDQNFKEDHNGTPPSATALSSAGPDSHYTSSGSLRSLGDSGVMPMWIAQWRKLWKQNGGQPQPLPLPNGRSYMSQSLLELLSAGPYNYTMHRCNFAVMFLSELVVDMYNFEWAQFLPRILHVLTLGKPSYICMWAMGHNLYVSVYVYTSNNVRCGTDDFCSRTCSIAYKYGSICVRL